MSRCLERAILRGKARKGAVPLRKKRDPSLHRGHERQRLAEELHRIGDDLMAALGMERLPDGNWREEDLDLIWRKIKRRGLRWAYQMIEASGLIAE
jgi:hypothetical protein